MSFLETPTASLKNFMCRGERASQGQSQLLAVPIASPKTLGIENRGFLFSYRIFMYLWYVKKVFSICIVNI